MKKRRSLSAGKFLVLLNLAWFSIVALLLAANGWQYKERQQLTRENQTISKELRWQTYVTAKAKRQVKELPILRFLAVVMETRDADLYAIATAAWRYGRALERWPQVRNGPSLVMAVVHRESNFKPWARSYKIKKDADGNPIRDGNGNQVKVPVAYGPAQINLKVWLKPLNLNPAKIHDPDYNIRHAVTILDGYLEKRNGNLAEALFDYWGGALAGGSYTYPPRVLGSNYFSIHPPGTVGTSGVIR